MIFSATPDGMLDLGTRQVRCALGRSGVVPAADKREGDGASPAGVWPIRRVLYRPDKGPVPETALPIAAIQQDDGWCDAAGDPAYNRPVKLPYPASAEHMWRTEDEAYDVVVVLGHNDDPVIDAMGSAIFLHIRKPGYTPTEGCVAIAPEDMRTLLQAAKPGDSVEIRL